MLDEGNNDNLETPEAQPPEESNNRTFLIVGGIIAALIFLTLVCGAIYVLYLGPRLTAQRNAAQATIEAGNAQVVQQMTSTALAALFTPTSKPTTKPTNTLVPAVVAVSSPTPVLAVSTPRVRPPLPRPGGNSVCHADPARDSNCVTSISNGTQPMAPRRPLQPLSCQRPGSSIRWSQLY